MAAAKQPETDAERQAAQWAYDEFLERAKSDPIKYIKHDVRAHDDEALYRLTYEHGMAYYGLYWLLVELLTGRKDHYYDVSDDAGWRRLARDMGCICDMSVEECRTFIGDLYKAELISREHFDELHKVCIKRVNKHANELAEASAAKAFGAWKTNRKRMLG